MLAVTGLGAAGCQGWVLELTDALTVRANKLLSQLAPPAHSNRTPPPPVRLQSSSPPASLLASLALPSPLIILNPDRPTLVAIDHAAHSSTSASALIRLPSLPALYPSWQPVVIHTYFLTLPQPSSSATSALRAEPQLPSILCDSFSSSPPPPSFDSSPLSLYRLVGRPEPFFSHLSLRSMP